MLPMAVPGMVLGLAYIFFFNNPPTPSTSSTPPWRSW
jgi:ABC-type Fe3+ transport system permease subunit